MRTWAQEFLLLGGYDQEPGIMPSSQQDVDLRNRSIKVWKQHLVILNAHTPSEKILSKIESNLQLIRQFQKTTEHNIFSFYFLRTEHTSKTGIGSAVPNAATKKADRGEAQIGNVDPHILVRFGTWSRMKAESERLLKEKQQRHVRNYPDCWAMQNQMYKALKDDALSESVWNLFRSCQPLSPVFPS